MRLTAAYLYIIITLKIFLLVLIGLSTERFVSASNNINLTNHIIDTVEQVTITLLNAETGQRGFVITGDDRYLEPYLSANISLDAQLNDMQRSLTTQRANMVESTRVTTLAHQKMQELDRTVKIRQNEGFEAAAAIINQGHGKDLMDQTRDALTSISNYQVLRSNSLNDQIKDTGFVILSGVIVFFILLMVTIVGVRDFFK